MQFSIFQNPLNTWQGNSLIIGMFEEDILQQLEKYNLNIDAKLLTSKLLEKDFQGKKGQILNFEFLDSHLNSVLILGLGKVNKIDYEYLTKSIADCSRKICDVEEKSGILLPWRDLENFSFNSAAEIIRLSIFRDNRFNHKKDEKISLKEVEFLGFNDSKEISFQEIQDICAGVEFARELVAAPPNFLTPLEMSRQALDIAKNYNLEVKILGTKECEDLSMGAYLAVAKGSDLEPKFIHLIYKSNDDIKKKIALVGKGLTFDSGGYNLKVGAGSQIDMMKYDMGGSAAVLGTAKAIGAIKPQGLEIHFIIASCENMINGSAFHPGDVITASNGKTIEINNTDAEGRLTLADALTYASNLNPDTIIDLATLTGACVIALGGDLAGLWSNNNQLANDLLKAASEVGEGMWHMPLQKSYKEGLKSHIADMKNTGPRGGGSITAALFLEEFFNENINWAHIDIAGTCWADKNKGLNPSGATGYGVRTLVKWIQNI